MSTTGVTDTESSRAISMVRQRTQVKPSTGPW
jgi:hypothetical protein